MSVTSPPAAPPQAPAQPSSPSTLLKSEDWWSVWIGLTLVVLAATRLLPSIPKAHLWTSNPLEAFPARSIPGLLTILFGYAGLTAVGIRVMGGSIRKYLPGFAVVFALGLVSMLLGAQSRLDHHGLEYALWGLLIGRAVANTVGAPGWLLAGAKSEWFIKIGLVLMGAEVLVSKILAYGPRGLIVAWIVTPIVILFMYFFGTRILRISSRTLVMVIACATSVCGVSAAIASAAACRAKREELSLVVGMSMLFTVAMMVGMPALSKVMGLDDYVAGAWIGGTVDSTGAVVAAGEIFSDRAGEVAALVKMIQNALIGIVAFVIALVWVWRFDASPSERPGMGEIWRRFPKFVVGFVGVSLFFSFVLIPLMGDEAVKDVIKTTKGLRNWWFALAFAAIGLESNFRQMTAQLSGGKPIWLYTVGQSFNIVLTLLAAWLAFGDVLFGPISE